MVKKHRVHFANPKQPHRAVNGRWTKSVGVGVPDLTTQDTFHTFQHLVRSLWCWEFQIAWVSRDKRKDGDFYRLWLPESLRRGVNQSCCEINTTEQPAQVSMGAWEWSRETNQSASHKREDGMQDTFVNAEGYLQLMCLALPNLVYHECPGGFDFFTYENAFCSG